MIFDFRLKVFYTVARKLSFTKAANELFITQPAVTKHINELEQQLGVGLFKRQGNSISITPAGQILLEHAQKIFQIYATLENDLVQLTNTSGGNIHIGASTTLAQYVLPRILARFKSAHPAIHFTFTTGNSEQIEHQLIHEEIDIAIVEGISHHPQIMYEPFVKDEIVLVTRSNGRLARKNEIKPEHLLTLPLILREHGSGTLDVIYNELSKAGIHPKDLLIEIQLDSTESIKQYLLHADCAAFLSIHSIEEELQQNKLSIIDIKGIDIYRSFQFITLHGQASRLIQIFKRFCVTQYNLK
ncbi:LysR substrate-binding domain-containing protein [Pontibacter beigongshangensis]|uniref:LysR substrate-binding domain-containing protein n=1 Tax=Pontibacter beigongshangensis TaxID=2574733 RepID=UPI001889093B|nr:LysR substrate-binding domain-containing protein [Pontibacter beigongshangensis]